MSSSARRILVFASPVLLLAVGCKPAPPTDPALANAVQQKLSGDSALSSEPIQASVQDGVVTLTGTVSSDAARSLASTDTGAVPGVRTVLNNLVIQAPIASAPVPAPPAPLPEPTPAPRIRTDPKDRKQRQQAQEREAQERERNRRRQNSQADLAQTTPPPAAAPAPIALPPAAPAPPPPPPAPVLRSVTLDSGTTIPVRLSQDLNSGSAQQGQTFSGTVSSDVLSPDGIVILHQGSTVSGRITAVQEAAHFKGNALLSLELTGVTRNGKQIAISTSPFTQQGNGRGKNTAEKAGIGAAAGAVLGGIFGGGRGAAIGAAAGGGTGVGINAVTRGQQADIPAETLVRFQTTTPITVRVSSQEASTATPSTRRPLQ